MEAGLQLRFYGRLAEAIGSKVELDHAPGCSVAKIREQLCKRHPEARRWLGRSRVLVGDRFVDEDHPVASSDRIEFLPPVSGG